jgi:hypothetical protein
MKPLVFWYNDCRGSWCHAIVEWLTAECQHVNGSGWEIDANGLANTHGAAVVVFKADQIKTQSDVEHLISFLANFEAVLVFMTANEEGTLNPKAIRHPRMRMWIQTPTRAQRQWASCGIPWGWTPGFDGTRWLERLPGYEATESDRMLDFSFVGQLTHHRRNQCLNAAKNYESLPSCVLTSSGFGRGLPKHLYFELLVNSKVVLCPSGPQTADTFRVWEALEAGALPVVDNHSYRDDEETDYWDYIAGPNHPFKPIEHWDKELGEGLEYYLQNWRMSQAFVLGWWQGRKRFWQEKFRTDLEMLNVSR